MAKRIDGRTLDHDYLERIRFHAASLFEDNVPVRQIAKVLGFSESAVYEWKAAYKKGGLEALRSTVAPGPARRLSSGQLQELLRMLVCDCPDQYELDFGLWTLRLVRDVIVKKFGVAYSTVQVGNILHDLGFSPQKPTYRAYESNDDEVAHWRDTEFSKIRKEAKKVGATIFFADEAGIRSDHHSGRTWAKVGQRPLVRTTGNRFGINMLSAVSAKGELHFMVVDASVKAQQFKEFCEQLVRDIPTKVFLIVDGHPIHKAKIVKEYVQSTDGRLSIFFLPPYSPFLNPDEWVWKLVKHDNLKRMVIKSKDDLKQKSTKVLTKIKNQAAVVQGIFRDPQLAYITE